MKLFRDSGIVAAPVFSNDEGWLGFVNVFDIMSYIAFFTHFHNEATEGIPESFAHLETQVNKVLSISTETASQLWVGYSFEETLGSIASRMSSGIHRMLLSVDDEARLLTQTDIVKFIYEHDKSGLKDKPLKELGLADTKKICSVNVNSSALVGFRTIYKQHVSAIAILDDKGKIVGTLSSSDVRVLVTEEDLMGLSLTVKEFLEKNKIFRSPIAVTANSTLGDTMKAVLDGKVHRAWIDDGEGAVYSVVTLSDIIRLWYN
uniref:CBS domain-containing protein n=1 Tax=Arcella intermedia TaxID=1963864 RepID=A0A6B2LE11_9EUKA